MRWISSSSDSPEAFVRKEEFRMLKVSRRLLSAAASSLRSTLLLEELAHHGIHLLE